MRYPYVLLDLDHTLFDTDTSLKLAFADAMAAVGVEADGHYPCFDEINREHWRAVERSEMTPDEVHVRRFRRLIAALGIGGDGGGRGTAARGAADDAEVMSEAFAQGLGAHGELYEGARDVLDQLAGRAALGLVTNGLREVQRARLERLDLERYFDAVVISAEVGVAKPNPAIFELAFAGLGRPALDASLMVGDSLTSDIAGGNGYGVATCWYNPNRVSTPRGDAAATYEIAELRDLVGIATGR